MAKITLEKLAESIDTLATMVKKGFDAIDAKFGQVETKFGQIETRLTNIEQGQEDVILKLDNFAYKFEVKELQKRVTKLERKYNDITLTK
jgi:polyhydroxyalkanoate synthesis regulator phasin